MGYFYYLSALKIALKATTATLISIIVLIASASLPKTETQNPCVHMVLLGFTIFNWIVNNIIPHTLPRWVQGFLSGLFFFPDPFERLVVRLTVQEPAGISIPFHPITGFRVLYLTPAGYLAISVAIT